MSPLPRHSEDVFSANGLWGLYQAILNRYSGNAHVGSERECREAAARGTLWWFDDPEGDEALFIAGHDGEVLSRLAGLLGRKPRGLRARIDRFVPTGNTEHMLRRILTVPSRAEGLLDEINAAQGALGAQLPYEGRRSLQARTFLEEDLGWLERLKRHLAGRLPWEDLQEDREPARRIAKRFTEKGWSRDLRLLTTLAGAIDTPGWEPGVPSRGNPTGGLDMITWIHRRLQREA